MSDWYVYTSQSLRFMAYRADEYKGDKKVVSDVCMEEFPHNTLHDILSATFVLALKPKTMFLRWDFISSSIVTM